MCDVWACVCLNSLVSIAQLLLLLPLLLSPSSSALENDVIWCAACRRMLSSLSQFVLLLLFDFVELPKLMSARAHTHAHTHTSIACEAKFKSWRRALPTLRALSSLCKFVLLSLSRVVRKLLRQKQLKRPSVVVVVVCVADVDVSVHFQRAFHAVLLPRCRRPLSVLRR